MAIAAGKLRPSSAPIWTQSAYSATSSACSSSIASVTTAVAMGDLSKKITVPVKGDILELKKTINTMVDK